VADHGGGLDVHLPRGVSPEEVEAVADAVGRALAAWQEAGRRGNAPGEAVRLVEQGMGGAVPWSVLLQRFLRRSFGRMEWDQRRPDRRMLEEGFWLPQAKQEKRGKLVVAVDTSGSMGAALLSEFMGEVRRLAEIAPETTLVIADAKVQEVVEPGAVEAYLRRGRLKGGGGTDHRPVFKWVEESGIQPDLFVGLTDLFTRFPSEAPPYPVLWVVQGHHGKAPWGQVLEVEG
jgi:predicted metal-dependent peptidase